MKKIDKNINIENRKKHKIFGNLFIITKEQINNEILAAFGNKRCQTKLNVCKFYHKFHENLSPISNSKVKGVFHLVVNYILDKYPYDIRIDTHKNNLSMISSILKEGFKYTGIIYIIIVVIIHLGMRIS